MATNLDTVVIVGQANVGKSSLFNRLLKSKQAIIAKEAGTTRDNVIRKVSYQNHSFWLVDTAGLKIASDEFEASIQDQIADAISLASAIIVVADSTKYFTDDDRKISKLALKSKKPTILALNKSDLKGSLSTEKFRGLGIKNIIKTSAEHGEGVQQLYDFIIQNTLASSVETQDEFVKISLIGRPNSGKSQMFNALAGKQQALVANVAGTTRDVNKVQIKFKSKDIELLDTAGIRRSGKQEVGVEKFSVLRTMQAIEESDICLLLMDVNELNTQLDQKIAGLIDEAGKGLIIVVSKWDTLEDKDPYSRDSIASKITYNFSFVPWAPLIFTSSITGQNLTKIFSLALEILERRNQKNQTSKLNNILQKALDTHPPAGLKNTHPKLRYMVQTDTNPPWFVIYGSNLKLLHWSYKRFLERQVRENIDYVGTPIKFSFREEKSKKD